MKSFDGKEIEAALMRPATQGKLPLIVYVHGGPASRWRDQYDAFEAWGELLVRRGYAVFLSESAWIYRLDTGSIFGAIQSR